MGAGGEGGAEEAADAAARAIAAIGAAEVAGPIAAARAVNDAAGGPGSPVWGRRAGLAGAALGLVAAGVAVERLTVNRGVRRKARLALDAAGPYGTLRGTPGEAYAEDGTRLYYEVEAADAGDSAGEAGEASAPGRRGGDGAGGPAVSPVRVKRSPRAAGPDPVAEGERADPAGEGAAYPERSRLLRLLRLLRSRRGAARGTRQEPAPPAPPTVVFTHGYCLSQDAWHFQRAALRGAVRAVYWDQRSHGRSGRGPAGGQVSIDLLGRDLKAVLDAAVPEGPVVLVGHSMGGMTVMALAEQYPDYVAERVAGVAFVGTSAGGLAEVTYGLPLPALGVKAVRRVVPGLLRALVAQTELVEKGRRAAADLLAGLVKRYSFGGPDVDPGVARFAERLIESVPIDVVAEFYPAFEAHEKTAALAAFDGLPALVLAGDRDLLTPYAHSEAIADALPSARLLVLGATGHLSMLERPDAVNEALAELLTRTLAAQGRAYHPDA